MYAPWIRNIYIVTNGQTPSWLKMNHPRVEVRAVHVTSFSKVENITLSLKKWFPLFLFQYLFFNYLKWKVMDCSENYGATVRSLGRLRWSYVTHAAWTTLVKVIPHSEIFQKQSDLPTFNSMAIEVHLHKIQGLRNVTSSRFLIGWQFWLAGTLVSRATLVTKMTNYKKSSIHLPQWWFCLPSTRLVSNP